MAELPMLLCPPSSVHQSLVTSGRGGPAPAWEAWLRSSVFSLLCDPSSVDPEPQGLTLGLSGPCLSDWTLPSEGGCVKHEMWPAFTRCRGHCCGSSACPWDASSGDH